MLEQFFFAKKPQLVLLVVHPLQPVASIQLIRSAGISCMSDPPDEGADVRTDSGLTAVKTDQSRILYQQCKHNYKPLATAQFADEGKHKKCIGRQ